MWWLYNIALILAAPFWVPWMLLRALARKERPNWAERQGTYKFSHRKDRRRIWIHAVSVGEVIASIPILKEVRSQLPDYEIVLSVTTSSGHLTAEDQASGLYDILVYFPIDVARFMLSAMQRVQPAVVATVDTELWMNFLWAAKSFRATTLLINGRISDRSFPRAKKVKAFYKALFRDVDGCLMQTEKDAERIGALGAQNVKVLGNVKFDQAILGLGADSDALKEELRIPQGKPLIVIGSTRGAEEEALVLEALAAVGFDRVNVLHAPRHIERVRDLADAVKKKTGHVALRSKGESGSYLILDTYGELSQTYGLADIVIVGGGFEPLGGQNIIQPLAHGKPVIHGPHMENFRDASEAAHAAGATFIAKDSQAVAKAINQLLEQPERAQKMGEAARSFVALNVGASKRYAAAIVEAAEASGARVQKS